MMMSLKILFSLCLSLSLLFAQGPTSGGSDAALPGSSHKAGQSNHFSEAWGGDFNPFLEFNYGYAEPKHKTFASEYSKMGSYELKLGYSEVERFNEYAWSLDDRFLFGSYAKEEYNFLDDSKTGDVDLETWRFGGAIRESFGYGGKVAGLYPYNQNAMVWTHLNSVRPPGLSVEDSTILDRYEGATRFGQAAEGGLKFMAFQSLAFTASYELAVVYPRHIVLEWAGSILIESTAQSLISVFSEDIVNSSPFLGPILFFVLKNGVSYAFYTLRQDDMNWPFTSETPLTFETIKIGASVTF